MRQADFVVWNEGQVEVLWTQMERILGALGG